MWDLVANGQQQTAQSSWYDPTKVAGAVASQGAGADGRTVLSGQGLLSILNPLSGVTHQGGGVLTGSYTPVATGDGGPDNAESVETTGYDPGTYQANGSTFISGLPGMVGGWADEAGYKADMAKAAAAMGLDPSKNYIFNNWNNPTGNGSKDQAYGYYQVNDDGSATPVAASNDYKQSDWTDFYRPLLKNGAIVYGAAAGLGAAAGAAGATAGGATVGGGMSSSDLAALYGEAGYGAAGTTAAGTTAATEGAALGGGTLAGGGATSIGSGLGMEGFGSGLGSATTSAGVTGGLTETGALGAVGGSLSASGLTTAGVAGTGSTWMQDALKAATSPAGTKLIGAGLTAALAGGAASAAGGSAGTASGAQTDVATMQQRLAQQQLDFNKAAYDAGAPTRTAATAGAMQAQAGQLATQQQQNDIAKIYSAEDASTFAPLRQQIVSDAQNYDTAGRRADAVAGATSDVEQAYSSANAANQRAMLRAGVTPGSGRMQSLMADQAIAKANSVAGATTTAVRNVENTGTAQKAAAAQLGAFLPGAQAAAANSGTSAGTAAAGSGATGVATQAAGISGMNTGFTGATSANNSAGNLYGQAAGQKATADSAYYATLGNLGGAVGNYLGSTAGQKNLTDLADWISDEDVKTGTGKRANPMQALAQINATPVETGWRYDPDKGGPDDGAVEHTGPMAQAVRRTMGESVAPGGRSISAVDMNGKLMAGMQALSAKVAKLEKSRRAA